MTQTPLKPYAPQPEPVDRAALLADTLAQAMSEIRARCPQTLGTPGKVAVIEAALLVHLARAYDRGYHDGASHAVPTITRLETRVANEMKARRACTCGHGLTTPSPARETRPVPRPHAAT